MNDLGVKLFLFIIGGINALVFMVGLGLLIYPSLLRWIDEKLKKIVVDGDFFYRRPRLLGFLFLIFSVIIYWFLYFQKIYRFWE